MRIGKLMKFELDLVVQRRQKSHSLLQSLPDALNLLRDPNEPDSMIHLYVRFLFHAGFSLNSPAAGSGTEILFGRFSPRAARARVLIALKVTDTSECHGIVTGEKWAIVPDFGAVGGRTRAWIELWRKSRFGCSKTHISLFVEVAQLERAIF